MQTVRHNVFETNSSSTHSISISTAELNNTLLDSLPVDTNGEVHIYPGEYGWEYENYSAATDKASYCYVWAVQYGTEEHRSMLEQVLKKQTGAKKVVFQTSNDQYNPTGYIDHQSDDVGAEAFLSEETLRQFIFNKDSYFITDNDNR
jgi:hypothetical protein